MAAFRDYLVSVSRDRHMRLFPCICTFRYLVEASSRSFYCVLLKRFTTLSSTHVAQRRALLACVCVRVCASVSSRCSHINKSVYLRFIGFTSLSLHSPFNLCFLSDSSYISLYVDFYYIKRKIINVKSAQISKLFFSNQRYSHQPKKKKKEFINKNGQRQAFR